MKFCLSLPYPILSLNRGREIRGNSRRASISSLCSSKCELGPEFPKKTWPFTDRRMGSRNPLGVSEFVVEDKDPIETWR